jgi:hypothetical protein
MAVPLIEGGAMPEAMSWAGMGAIRNSVAEARVRDRPKRFMQESTVIFGRNAVRG